ncbi:MAG: type II toxin-antitoxin system VapC family toxin [Chlamydiales bacterium]|nr:type II toxin-antitoxin system VapC family toxin [Chlamydiales bacterium]
MIGLDTNLIVRYLIQDDAAQTKKANLLIENAAENGTPMWISQITLCETIWVLDRGYKLPKQEILHILHELLQTPEIKIENDSITWLALHDYETSKSVGFVDCLIGRQNAYNGCTTTYTLDKQAAKKLQKTFTAVV